MNSERFWVASTKAKFDMLMTFGYLLDWAGIHIIYSIYIHMHSFFFRFFFVWNFGF